MIEWVDVDSALDRLLVGLEKKDPKVSLYFEGGWHTFNYDKHIVMQFDLGLR